MPVNLSIKEVPDAMAERLRSRAERNHRSLQGELMAIIERAAAEAGAPAASAPADFAQPTQLLRSHGSVLRGSKTIEQTAALRLAAFPQPIPGLPRAADIIREDRDRR